MKTYRLVLDPTVATAPTDAGPVCCFPSQVAGEEVAALVGYPTGKHHPLIKATEARLAVSHGASLIIAIPDPALDDNAHMMELITLREAVPHPTSLAVLCANEDRARLAVRCGIDALAVGITETPPRVCERLAGTLPLIAPTPGPGVVIVLAS